MSWQVRRSFTNWNHYISRFEKQCLSKPNFLVCAVGRPLFTPDKLCNVPYELEVKRLYQSLCIAEYTDSAFQPWQWVGSPPLPPARPRQTVTSRFSVMEEWWEHTEREASGWIRGCPKMSSFSWWLNYSLGFSVRRCGQGDKLSEWCRHLKNTVDMLSSSWGSVLQKRRPFCSQWRLRLKLPPFSYPSYCLHKCLHWGWSEVWAKELTRRLSGLRRLIDRRLPFNGETEKHSCSSLTRHMDLNPWGPVSLPLAFS